MSEYEQSVFISYAWGTEREDIVNEIDETLQQRGIRIVRDKRALGYRGSIKDFMERIGRGSCVIVVISDKYLRSPNCMFELVEIAENKQFHDRVFPVILTDANIYDPLKRIEYIKYWEGKRKELAKAMKTLDPANLHGIREEMDQYDRIRDKISGITSILKDMNTLTPDMHRDSEFSNLYDAIVERLRETSTDVTTEFNEMAKKAEAERKAKEEADRLAAQKAEMERIEREKAEAERIARAEAERRAKEEADRLSAQKAEEERLARVEAERKAKAEADRLAAQKAEEERIKRERAEQERLALARAEEERKAKEEAERIARQKAEEERIAKLEAERKAKEDREAKAEADRLAAQKAEAERIAQAKAEAERRAKAEAERLAAQKAERERIEREKAEAERKAKEEAAQKAEEEQLAKVEAERKAKEDAARVAAQKAERERVEREKAEQERRALAKVEAERKAKEAADREAKVEAERLVKQKAEEKREAKEKAVPAPAMPVEMTAEGVSVAPAQQKPTSKVMMYGIGAVVLLAAVLGIGFSVLNSGNKNTPVSTPTTQAAVVAPATEAPATEAPVTEVPVTEALIEPTLTDQPTLTPSVSRPTIDGLVSETEWVQATVYDFPHGKLYYQNDDYYLYVLIDLIRDTVDDGNSGGDSVSFAFDVNANKVVDANKDIKYAFAGMDYSRFGIQYYLDCGSFTGIDPSSPSGGKAGFSPSFNSTIPHRIWEFAFALNEIQATPSQRVRFGIETVSGSPYFRDNIPESFSTYSCDFSKLVEIDLERP